MELKQTALKQQVSRRNRPCLVLFSIWGERPTAAATNSGDFECLADLHKSVSSSAKSADRFWELGDREQLALATLTICHFYGFGQLVPTSRI